MTNSLIPIGSIVQIEYDFRKRKKIIKKIIKLYVCGYRGEKITGWLVVLDRRENKEKKDKAIYELPPIENYDGSYLLLFSKKRSYPYSNVIRILTTVSNEKQQVITIAANRYRLSRVRVNLKTKHNSSGKIPTNIKSVVSGGRFSPK